MKKLLLVGLAALFLGGCNRLDIHQPLTSHKLYFYKTNDLAQTFLSRRANLNTVYICLRNPDRTQIPLQFSLVDDQGVVVRQLDFTGGNIDNLDCTKFKFEPVVDSLNRHYTAHITVKLDPKLEPRAADGYRSGLHAEAHAGGDYQDGVALIDGVASEYDLHFKVYFFQDWRSVINESLAQLGRRLTADPLFMLIYLLGLGWMVTKLWRLK
jgi:hypothetical protein